MNNFRNLRADEIDCRAYIMPSEEAKILLYKDARCDQNILDETVGPMNWQRHHLRDNANCVVAIYDEKKNEWIEKEDTGTESSIEKGKGLASDSFKRACVNWGIGRELYTAPEIIIRPNQFDSDGRICFTHFAVSEIDYENGVISYLVIVNSDTGEEAFCFKKGEKPKSPVAKKISDKDLVKALLIKTGTKEGDFFEYFKVSSVNEMTDKQIEKGIEMLQKKANKGA